MAPAPASARHGVVCPCAVLRYVSLRFAPHIHAATHTANGATPAAGPKPAPQKGRFFVLGATTRKLTTHNTFFVMPDQRDAKLTATFNAFQRRPALIAAHVVRFQ